jgi:hypothetical protein
LKLKGVQRQRILPVAPLNFNLVSGFSCFKNCPSNDNRMNGLLTQAKIHGESKSPACGNMGRTCALPQ